MEHPVTKYITAGSITSSLGVGTQENMSRIREYRSGIRRIEDTTLFNTPFMAARLDDARLLTVSEMLGLYRHTRMEQFFIYALADTIWQSGIDPMDPECGLVLSTTKGNIDLLQEYISLSDKGKQINLPDPSLYKMGLCVADYFKCPNDPILVSNACISGVSALVVAARLIESGRFKHVLVAGGDILSRFVVTGFQSFKSVSPERCRPYDKDRDGLSLGEACGAVLVTTDRSLVREAKAIVLEGGSITNDANHISGPSRTGDGLYYAIRQAMDEAGAGPEDISFVNAHGTGTLYNDEMESKAIHWAGLDQVPLNSLKPYWGHTLGASGIIESIACMEELRRGELFGTLGFDTCGVPYPLSVSGSHREIPMRRCVKTASGFGGCNAAIVLALCDDVSPNVKKGSDPVLSQPEREHCTSRRVVIHAGKVELEGQVILETDPATPFPEFIRLAYKSLNLDDRKFYKMDDLCKLGYVAAASLFAKNGGTTGYLPGEVGLILANASSSLDTDLKHQRLIDTLGDQEASPAVFVYTLPNVVMGELCIRYKIQGENTFFISDRYQESFIREYALSVMRKQKLRACLIGWCELLGNRYEARFDWLEQIISNE